MRAVDVARQDQQDDTALIALMNRAAYALARAGLTARDLIDELPSAQDELLREDLGDDAVAELQRMHEETRIC